MKITAEAIKILALLTRAQIDYVLIRNFDCLVRNQSYNEKDIDILLLKKDCAKMTEVMQTEGFKKLMICPSAGHIGFTKYLEGKFLSFHYHVGGVAGSNIPYLDAGQLLQRKQQKNQVNIVSDEDQFLVILLHSVLDGIKIKPKYIAALTRRMKLHLDWGYIEYNLNLKLSQVITQKLLFYLQQNNYARIEKIIPQIQKNFKYGSYSRILQLIKSDTLKIFWSIWRITQNAPLVSVIGMDGTGKTTMTHLLQEKLDASLITNELIYTGRGRNNILPIQFFGAKYKTIKSISARQNNYSSSISLTEKIMYSIAAPIFAFDLFLRYWTKIWPKRKTKQIVLTDRYSTDILLMKNAPMLLKCILFWFLPKPTLIIYLYNHPKILHKRKPDHPLEDLYRQQRIFTKINKKVKPVRLKSDKIEATLDQICARASNTLV